MSGEPGDWWSDYAERVRDLAGDALRVNTDLARHWSRRSLEDDEWSVDTVTADLIEAWEYLTPLTGRAIDLCLDLVQQGSRPDATPASDTPCDRERSEPMHPADQPARSAHPGGCSEAGDRVYPGGPAGAGASDDERSEASHQGARATGAADRDEHADQSELDERGRSA